MPCMPELHFELADMGMSIKIAKNLQRLTADPGPTRFPGSPVAHLVHVPSPEFGKNVQGYGREEARATFALSEADRSGNWTCRRADVTCLS